MREAIFAILVLLLLSAPLAANADEPTEMDGDSDIESQCASHADCQLTQKCVSGQCVPLGSGDCAADADCPTYPDEYCQIETRSCRALCIDDGFCLGAGEYCNLTNHHCEKKETPDGDLDAETESDTAFCTTVGDTCPNGQYCDANQHICRPFCSDSSACELNEVCADRKCVPRVSADGDTDGETADSVDTVDIAEGYDDIDDDFEFAELDTDACPPGQVCIDRPNQKKGDSGCAQGTPAALSLLLLTGLSALLLRKRRATLLIVLFSSVVVTTPANAIDTQPSAEKIQAAVQNGVANKDKPEKLYAGYEFGTLGSGVNGYVQTKLCEIALRSAAMSAADKPLNVQTDFKDILERKHLLIPIYVPGASEAALNDIRVDLRQGLKTIPADELLKDPPKRVLCQGETCLYARDVFAGFWFSNFDPQRVAVLVVHVGSQRHEFPLSFDRMD